MLISPEQETLIDRVFETYLRGHHHADILQLIADTDEETHQAVFINAMTLFEANMEIGDYFNAYPNDVMAVFDKVLQRTAMDIVQNALPKPCEGQPTKEQRMRHTLHARITGLPVCPELTRDTIPKSRDVGHYLSVTGTVIRTSVAKVLEYERDYMCTKCRHVFTVQADFDQFYTFVPPMACPTPDGCNSYKFSCLSGGSEPAACRDYQEIKIQEQVQRLSVGSIPRSMVVVLEDDLVDSCKSGDDVTVYGVICQRWKPFYEGARCDVELVLKANNIEVNNQQGAAALLMKDARQEFEAFWESFKCDPIAGRNQILLSLCPQVFGMYVIKMAVAMVLAGGVQRIDSSGTKIRGECHMLLVGDPGTGKSQFLKYSAKIMPRSVLTAGIGSTSAGLTVAAVKDGGDWHLEAGALVLSDGGLCCIDEFNSIKEHDRISIHEAMEQQSISVAKAGMVCKLNTRTTILAATNPKGQYDPNEPLFVNVALASPLLSRFDLVLVLLDTRNAEWDRVISSFILEDRGPAESSSLWPMEKMKAYFSVIKQLQPQVSVEANSILSRYYQLQRQSDCRNAARTTIRMLESLSRLAEAHARLMYRETVTIEDAVMAVSVMECSMQGGAMLGNVNALLTSFPADPEKQYEAQCRVLLEGLNMPVLLQKELDRLARLKNNTLDTPQFDPPTGNYQQQLGDASTINKTHLNGSQVKTSDYEGDVTVESGLDWFHSITPSALASPIITSTQNLNRNPNSSSSETSTAIGLPNCQTDMDLQNNTRLAVHCDGTVSSASEVENRKREKNINMEEKRHPQDVNQAERTKDYRHPKSSECVFQKVSKNLRDRRLREQELNHQKCNKDRQGGHEDRGVSTGGAGTNVTNTLNPNFHRNGAMSPGKNSPSINLKQVNQSLSKHSTLEKKVTMNPTKKICAVLRDKMAAEADSGKDIHAELLSFTFKPRKMRPLIHSHDTNAGSDISAGSQTEHSPGSRDPLISTKGRISIEKSVGSDWSSGPPSDTEKNVRKKQNQSQNLLNGGCRRREVSCVNEVGRRGFEDSPRITSVVLEKDVSFPLKEKSAQNESVGRTKGSSDSENLCHQQKTNTDKTIVDGITCSPTFSSSTSINNPPPLESSHKKSTIASSTLAKLTRFSFICSTENKATKNEEENPSTGVEQYLLKRTSAGCSRTNSDVNSTLDFPEHSAFGRKVNYPPTMVLAPEREHQLGRESSTKAEYKVMTEPDGDDYESIFSLKKRKCFELGPLPSGCGSKGSFSGLSLFGSDELSNDVLNIDWDKEISKKAKV